MNHFASAKRTFADALPSSPARTLKDAMEKPGFGELRGFGPSASATDQADAKTIPIIALTANAFDEDVQRSMQAGLNAHLSKPVEPDLLFETLEELLA